jgi:hypothetical protein
LPHLLARDHGCEEGDDDHPTTGRHSGRSHGLASIRQQLMHGFRR